MVIRLEPGAAEAIHAFLSENSLKDRAVRVDLRAAGCCDPSLVLVADNKDVSDLVEQEAGLTLVMRPEIYNLTGTVTIAFVNEPNKNGFVLTAERPLGEWDGFGTSGIQVENGPG